MVRRMPRPRPAERDSCQHGLVLPDRVFTSLESWDEILDLPEGPLIVRANGNWIARLAILAVLVKQLQVHRQRGSKLAKDPHSQKSRKDKVLKTYVTICPKQVCWGCNWKGTSDSEDLGVYFYPHVLIY